MGSMTRSIHSGQGSRLNLLTKLKRRRGIPIVGKLSEFDEFYDNLFVCDRSCLGMESYRGLRRSVFHFSSSFSSSFV